MSADALRLAVLVSGRGSNLAAILEACRRPGFPARVVVVLSDRQGARALDLAREAGVDAVFLDPKAHADRAAYDAALLATLERYRPGLVCLAGFMRILSARFVDAWAGRLMNIHPSLLPAFPGLRAQRQALDHGVKVAGATVHFAEEGVDTGPIIVQASVPVRPDDTEESLSARILVEEHRLYPEAIRLFAEGRLAIDGRRVIVKEGA